MGLQSWNVTASNAGANTQTIYNLIVTGALVSSIPLLIGCILLQRFWRGGLGAGSGQRLISLTMVVQRKEGAHGGASLPSSSGREAPVQHAGAQTAGDGCIASLHASNVVSYLT